MGEHGYKGRAWPQSRVEELIRLHQEGYSAGMIADRMGLSRNTVIGKAWRLGLLFSRTTQQAIRRKPIQLSSKQIDSLAAGRLLNRLLNIRKQLLVREKKLTKSPNDLGSKQDGVDIFGLTGERGIPTNCRAILHGTGIDAIYCGKPVYNRSYCYDHFRRFYHLSRDEQRAADRAAGYK